MEPGYKQLALSFDEPVEEVRYDVLLEPEPLRKEVEFANVQRVFEESKAFQFSAPNKIRQPRDVAYIFKQLETAAVENAFAVLVKDGKPTVIHLGMGKMDATFAPIDSVVVADKKINADKIYFVHNHPSGNVKASPQDVQLLQVWKNFFGDKMQPGIIINTRSGLYGEFDANQYRSSSHELVAGEEQQYPVRLYSFSKLVFQKEYRETSKIQTSRDVAQFVSSQRLGERPKLSYLVVSNGCDILANIHTQRSRIQSKDIKDLSRQITRDVVMFGGKNVISYGSAKIGKDIIEQLSSDLRQKEIRLLDHIQLLPDVDVKNALGLGTGAYHYMSASDEGWINPLREPGLSYGNGQARGKETEAADFSDEERLIVERAKSDGTYMKAPNGQPTKLSPKQWAQVRTHAFKDWFGDWELRYKTVENVIVDDDAPTDRKQARQKLAELTQPFHNTDQDVDIYVSQGDARHSLSFRSEDQIRALSKVNELIKKAVKVGEVKVDTSEKETTKAVHIYYAPIKIKEQQYSARLVVKEYFQGNQVLDEMHLYNYQLRKMASPAQSTSQTLLAHPGKAIPHHKISDLIHSTQAGDEIFLNNHSKVVDENGEPLVVYHGTAAEFNTFQSEKGTYWFAKNTDYSESMAEERGGARVVDVYLNMKKPYFAALKPGMFTNPTFEKPIIKEARDSNHDGVILRADTDNELLSDTFYVTFSPSQIKSAKENVGTFDMENADIRFRFIGEKGAANLDKAEEATTRLDNLAVAREMEEAGKDAKTVKMATSWERGADGKWRYEEADFEVDVNGLARKNSLWNGLPWGKEYDALIDKIFSDVALNQAENARLDELSERARNLQEVYEATDERYLDDYVKDRTLFEAYPELKRVRVEMYDEPNGNTEATQYRGATWYVGQNLIRVNERVLSQDDFRSVLTHEVQHAIQNIEGFAKGGNRNTYKEHLESLKEKHDAWSMLTEFDRKHEELGQESSPIDVYNAVRDEYLSLGFKFGEDGFSSREAFDKGFNLWVRGYDKEGYEDAYNEYQSLTDKFGHGVGNDGYTQLAGEVEARNVQARLNMSPEERRASLASETEDVAREKQIFLNETQEAAASLAEYAGRDNRRILTEKSSLTDVIKVLYEQGKNVASKMFQRSFFTVAQTPEFMKQYGITGDRFTIAYGTIARHFEKDSSHNLSEKEWAQLPAAIQTPFAITKLKDRKNAYRIYTELKNADGEYVVVGVDVKNAGRNIEVNSIATVFGRRQAARLTINEEVIYRSKRITLDQSSLLERPNCAQYPTSQGLSECKDTINNQSDKVFTSVHSQIKDLGDKLHTPIRIVKAENVRHDNPDMEKRMREAKGWFNTKTGEVVLIIDNHTSMEDVTKSVLHEVVAHKGLRGIMNEKTFQTMCESVFRSMPPALGQSYLRQYGTPAIAGEEYMAHVAENGASASVMSSITSAIKVALNSIGIQVNYSNKEIQALLKRSQRHLEKNPGQRQRVSAPATKKNPVVKPRKRGRGI